MKDRVQRLALQAIMLQLLTAVGALTGCVVSLVLGGSVAIASKLILPFTAGHYCCGQNKVSHRLKKTGIL